MSKTNFIDGDPSQGILGTVVTSDFLNGLNNHHHTGLDQDGHGALPYAVDTGTANAYVVNLNPALTQYVSGMPIYFKAVNTNTGASTIDVNGLGVRTIKKTGSIDLSIGDIQAGQIAMIIYNGTNFQLQGAHATNADALLADGVYRTASATPTANTFPVRDANKDLGDRNNNVLWGPTGQASAHTTTNATTLNLGTVTNGDIIDADAQAYLTWSSAPTAAMLYIDKQSGTATVQFLNGNITTTGTPLGTEPGLSVTRGMCHTRIKVTGSGTLFLRSAIATTGGAGISVSSNQIDVLFLKKQ